MPSQQQPRLERTDKMSSTKAVQTRKPASKRVATPKKKAAARNPPTQKKAIKTTASMKNTVVKVAHQKNRQACSEEKDRSEEIANPKRGSQEGRDDKISATKSAPKKTAPKKTNNSPSRCSRATS